MYAKKIPAKQNIKILPILLVILFLSSYPITVQAQQFTLEPIRLSDTYAGLTTYDLREIWLSTDYILVYMPKIPLLERTAPDSDPIYYLDFTLIAYLDIDGNVETGLKFISSYTDPTLSEDVFPALPGSDATLFVYLEKRGIEIRYGIEVLLYSENGSSIIYVNRVNGSATYINNIGAYYIPYGINYAIDSFVNVTGKNPGPIVRIYIIGDHENNAANLLYEFYDSITVGNGKVNLTRVNITIDGSPDDWPESALAFIDHDNSIPINGSVFHGNITRVYFGVDDDWFYIGVMLDQPIIDPMSYSDVSSYTLRLFLNIDYNNDGVEDSYLWISNYNVLLVNNSQQAIYLEEGSGYQAHLTGSFLEVAINRTIMAPGLGPGDSLWILNNSHLGLWIYDYLDSNALLDFVPGKGAYIPSAIPLAYRLGYGLHNISVYDISISLFSRSSSNWLIVDRPWMIPIPVEPPVGQVPAAIVYLYLWNPDSMDWPINITIWLDESTEKKIILEEAKVYIYNKTAGSFVEARNYTIDLESLKVKISLSEEEYLAGDPVILVSGPPAMVGGRIIDASETMPPLALAIGIILLLVGLARRS